MSLNQANSGIIGSLFGQPVTQAQAMNAIASGAVPPGQVSLAQLNAAAQTGSKVVNNYPAKQYVPAVLTGMMSHMESRLMDPESLSVIVWDVAEAIAKEGHKRGF